MKKDAGRCRCWQVLSPKASLRGAWSQERGAERWAAALLPLASARCFWARLQTLGIESAQGCLSFHPFIQQIFPECLRWARDCAGRWALGITSDTFYYDLELNPKVRTEF